MIFNDPLLPHIRGCGLAVCGGGAAGWNSAGRLAKFQARRRQRHVEVAVGIEGHNGGEGNAAYWINGRFASMGGSSVQRATQRSTRQEVTLDAIPVPPHRGWKNLRVFIEGSVPQNIRVRWDGDADTQTYQVHHATESDKSNSRRLAIHSFKKYIEVEDLSSSGQTIIVGGSDGVASRASSYLITIDQTTDGDEVTLQTQVEDVIGGTTSEWETYIEGKRFFGSGLYFEIPETYDAEGENTFGVTVTPVREFIMRNVRGDNHYFRIESIRGDGDASFSTWKTATVESPPDPVENLAVAYSDVGEIEVSFDMPNDPTVVGAKIFLSEPNDEGYEIPFAANAVEYVAGTSGQSKSVTISDLDPGLYTMLVRTIDADGMDDGGGYLIQFQLTATGVSSGALLPPVSAQAETVGIGSAKLTARVSVKGNEDSVHIFSDNGTGEIDWDTLWGVMTAKTLGVYTQTFNYLPAGNYLFGFRSAFAGVAEPGKDVLANVTVYDSKISVPSNVRVEVFEEVEV